MNDLNKSLYDFRWFQFALDVLFLGVASIWDRLRALLQKVRDIDEEKINHQWIDGHVKDDAGTHHHTMPTWCWDPATWTHIIPRLICSPFLGLHIVRNLIRKTNIKIPYKYNIIINNNNNNNSNSNRNSNNNNIIIIIIIIIVIVIVIVIIILIIIILVIIILVIIILVIIILVIIILVIVIVIIIINIIMPLSYLQANLICQWLIRHLRPKVHQTRHEQSRVWRRDCPHLLFEPWLPTLNSSSCEMCQRHILFCEPGCLPPAETKLHKASDWNFTQLWSYWSLTLPGSTQPWPVLANRMNQHV